ncbi:MAG TPA: hypothetical protein VF077_06175 [Nitrospiraceae bacterium]
MNTLQNRNVASGIDIAARAMLVRLTIRTWNCSIVDNDATNETLANKQASIGAGKFQKQLLSKSVVKALKASYGAARNAHYELTLPWSDSGDRILAANGFMRYSSTMGEFQNKTNALLEEFLQSYPQAINDAENYLLGTMFDRSNYPSVTELRDKYELTWKIRQIPISGDFRVELSDSASRAIKAQIEADLHSTLVAANETVIERVRVAVTNMRDKLEAYVPASDGNKSANWFKDSLVSNVRDLVELMPSLNITGDKRLDDIAAMMQRDLTRFDADQLKASDGEREKTAIAANDILTTMEEYGL